jgi:Ca-activated chloride channel family protein
VTRRLILTLAAAALIVLAIHTLVIAGRPTLAVALGGREVELLEPRWLYLLGLLPYFWLVRGASLTDLSLGQQVISTAVRSLLVAGIALALARPTTVDREDKLATVLLCDVSASVSDRQLAAAQEFVDAAWAARREEDLVTVVTFAERPEVLRPAGDGRAPRLARHAQGGAATDLQAALQLAYGLYPPGYLPRAVILSDGNQTAGDVLAEGYKARDFGVRVSWRVLSGDRTQEIRAVALHLPEEVKVGAPFELIAEVWSTHTEEVTLLLRQDDFPNGLEPQKTVTLHEGVNRVPFKTEAKAAGFSTYTLRVRDPKGDAEKENNVTVASTPVKGRPRVLYLEGEHDRDPQVSGYVKRALDRENIDVEVRGARGAPSSVKELERYDLVLVSDVPSMFLGLAQMQALEAYVRDLGGGFVMSGGEDSFGSGGYQGTRIEKILPVRFDGEKQLSQPQLAIALVIDRSGSMTGEKIEMAKESARATAEVLEASDLLSVVAFDSQPTTIVRLQRASNRLRISTDIARLTPGGGTNIHPALQEAFNVLSPANAKVKHVILLTDGQASYEGIAELVDEMRQSRITVSAVGVGDADRTLLSLIAERGEGKLYMTENAAELPKIFMKETQEIQKSSLVEDLVHAHVAKRVEMIEGTGVENAPPLRGYVATKAKDLAEVVLVTDRGEPLLARWRVGLGQVVAWTSDLKNRWASEWLKWPGFPKFLAQIVRTSMRHKQHESYDLAAEVVDGRARVTVDAIDRDDRFVNGLATVLEIVDPRDSKVKKTVTMEQTAAGRYEAELPIDRYGTYVLKAVHRRDGAIVAESVGAVSLPYPSEFLRSTPDPEPLRQVGVVTGGRPDVAPADVARTDGETIEYHRDLWPLVLLAVAIFFMIDLYLRRVRVLGHRAMRF